MVSELVRTETRKAYIPSKTERAKGYLVNEHARDLGHTSGEGDEVQVCNQVRG